jgi:8-oxo-dGTP pyrophosphatase MutT (NUDIX family)
MYSVSKHTRQSHAFHTLSFRTKRTTPRAREPSTAAATPKSYNIFGAVLRVRREGCETKYAMVQGRYTGKWSFPKGHSNPDESPYQCAIREVVEETGMKYFPDPVEVVSLAFAQYFVFDFDEEFPLLPEDDNEIMDTCWVTLEEMAQMKLNADANEYKRRLLLTS